MRDADGKLVTIGAIPGSEPKLLPVRTRGGFFDGLEIKDIPGTAVGSRRMGNFHSKERTQYRAINATDDVPGA